MAAASASSAGWKGAALYLDEGNGQLNEIGSTDRNRSVVGSILEDLSGSQSVLLENGSSVLVELASDDQALSGAGWEGLADGANLAVIGGELIQYGSAEHITGRQWRIHHLLRGRGGTEAIAQTGHISGAPFALVDDTATRLDPSAFADRSDATIAAIGLADAQPVTAPLVNGGIATRPLTPVHPSARLTPSGSLELCWFRRARGAWNWLDGIDAALVEQSESYRVGIGPINGPLAVWEVSQPTLNLDASTFADLSSNYPGQKIWVRQVGTHDVSDPLLLFTFS